MNLSKKQIFALVALVFLFFVFRFPAINAPYHQDEYKWVLYSHPELTPPGTVPHPPLTEFIYTRVGPIVGDLNFRVIPLFFSFLNLFLLFYLVKIIFNKRTAFVAITLFTFSFYSVLASVMVDVDGAVMPFFFLLSLIAYYKLKYVDFTINKYSAKWLVLLALSIIAGFLIKVVFFLPIAVLALDFAIEKRLFKDKKKFLKFSFFSLVGIVILGLVLYLSKYIFPFFNLEYSFGYWKHFANFSNRGWTQTFIQFAKAMFFASPFLILSLAFISKEIIHKTRPLIIFLVVETLFYLFAFDFSIGALDRYFQLMIIPLCVIVSAILYSVFTNRDKPLKNTYTVIVAFLAVLLGLLQFVPHLVPPLHPKLEWIGRITSLKWNFLYPFSGGSGPLGFYMSFLFLGVTWFLSAIAVAIALFKPNVKKIALVFLVGVGAVYNFSFTEEYLFGRINGSAPKVLSGAVEYIKNNDDIKFVTVYNDNGGFEIQQLGKYRKRLYTDPAFDADEKIATLNKYKEHYLEVNVPRIDLTSFYRRYLDSCEIIYAQTDKSISATVYDCKNAPFLKK